MSLAGQRQRLVDVLTPLDYLVPSTYRPMVLGTGSAYPLQGGLSRDEPRVPGYAVVWNLVVVLPADEVLASEWFDAHHEEIAETINLRFGFVSAIDPGLIETPEGLSQEAMFFTIRKEA